MRRNLAAALALAAAALASALLFFYFRDNFATHYPVKVLSAAAWRAGQIPWWNFHAGGGQPLAGNPNTLSFYPDNVLYLLLPAHVAFNLHFLLHLAAAWLAMRALTRSRWAAWLYVFSGIAISAMCFYNLIVALAMVPFALWASERGRWLQLGAAFGLMALAGEPVTIVAAAIACLWSAAAMPPLFKAVPIAALIASPQLIAYSEIAREVERGAFRYSAQTVLAASFAPIRFLELLAGPLFGMTMLFPTLIIGVIVIPAIFRRSRYTWIAALMFFVALGRFNPPIAFLVERVPALRLGRYPEKFALVGCVALIVLVAEYFRETRFKLLWTIATFVPLIAWAAVLLPVDLFAPYDVPPLRPRRVFVQPYRGGQIPNRSEYRLRARHLEPIFGAVAGLYYALDRSPDGMYSIRTRIASERYAMTRNPNYAAVVLDAPRAFVVPQAVVGNFERIDPHTTATAPQAFVSPAEARVTAIRGEWAFGAPLSPLAGRGTGAKRQGEGRHSSQTFEIDVTTPAPALLFVNETYFRAWVAETNGRELETMPIDVDRLGVVVPAGTHTIRLTFGRHHLLVCVAWLVSLLTLAAVEVLDRRTRQVERASHEERLAA